MEKPELSYPIPFIKEPPEGWTSYANFGTMAPLVEQRPIDEDEMRGSQKPIKESAFYQKIVVPSSTPNFPSAGGEFIPDRTPKINWTAEGSEIIVDAERVIKSLDVKQPFDRGYYCGSLAVSTRLEALLKRAGWIRGPKA